MKYYAMLCDEDKYFAFTWNFYGLNNIFQRIWCCLLIFCKLFTFVLEMMFGYYIDLNHLRNLFINLILNMWSTEDRGKYVLENIIQINMHIYW